MLVVIWDMSRTVESSRVVTITTPDAARANKDFIGYLTFPFRINIFNFSIRMAKNSRDDRILIVNLGNKNGKI